MPSAEEIARFKGRETTWDNTDSGGPLRYDAGGGAPPLLPATVTEHDLRVRQKLLDMEAVNAAVAGPVPANWDEWRAGFTSRVDKLGYVVQYQVDDGSIKVYQQGNLYTMFRDHRSAMGWLLREETERRDAETARRNAEADRIRSQAEAGELSNLATHAHVLEAILARLDALEERL